MTRCQHTVFLAGLMAAFAAISSSAQILPGLGNLPLYFEAQKAQDGTPQYLARSRTSQVLISASEVQISLRHSATVQVQFPGANPQAQIQGNEELAGKINYLVGNDATQWRTEVPTFAKVGIANLYPGIDAVYYGNEQQLEYDFNIAPGARPQTITMHFDGAKHISINARGELAVSAGKEEIRLRKPVIYQTVAGVRREIPGGYQIENAQTVAFAVGKYDPTLALVIDPILTYSSYLGGNGTEVALAVATHNSDGSIFIAGETQASNLTTNNPNVFQPKYQGGSFGDAFVAKFTPQGTNFNLVFLTYLGGSGDDEANALAVNQAGNAFVGGFTDSANFPTMNQLAGFPNQIHGSIDNSIRGTGAYPLDGFVSELTANGAGLVYSTYLGGNGEDSILALAIDSTDNAYVTGYTLSTNLPVKNPIIYTLGGTTNPTLNTLACTYTYFNCNAFIAKISNLGTNLDYLTYFGGTNFDVGTGIAVDISNNVYVAGYTDSTNFPNINSFQFSNTNSPQRYLNQSNYVYGVFDGFVAKLGPATNTPPALLYSTFLGNTNNDEANAIAVDSQGAAYVTGFTTSTNFYNTTTGLLYITNGTFVSTQPTYPVIVSRVTNNVNGFIYSTNVFLTKIVQTNADHSASIAYSVVFGGSLVDIGYGVAVDSAGNAFVTGFAGSTDFPTNNTLGFLSPVMNGGGDAFITAFNTNCSQVLYSAYLGGSSTDTGFAIAVDNQSTAYVVGQTFSGNFPVSLRSADLLAISTNAFIYNAHATNLNSSYDAFLAKIILTNFVPKLNLALTKGATNSVTLSWQSYKDPEIGPFTLETTASLQANNWISAGTPKTITNAAVIPITYTNTITVPALGTNKYFRLGQ